MNSPLRELPSGRLQLCGADVSGVPTYSSTRHRDPPDPALTRRAAHLRVLNPSNRKDGM